LPDVTIRHLGHGAFVSDVTAAQHAHVAAPGPGEDVVV
jgi:hypothetical protein